MSDLDEMFERPTSNQTGLRILLDNFRVVVDNTNGAVAALDKVVYLTKPAEPTDSLKELLNVI